MMRKWKGPASWGLFLSLCLAMPLRPNVVERAGAPVSVPAEFPSDFPVYKNATVKSYGPMVRANPKLGSVLVLETSDPKTAVLEFYKRELPVEGWKVERPFSDAPDSLAACKGPRRISVGVLESQAGAKRTTTIQLGVNESQ